MKKIILLFFVNVLFLAGFSATTITFNAGTGTDAGCTYSTGTYTITGNATIYVGNSNFTAGNVSINAITSGLGNITIAGTGLSTLSTANNLTIKAYGNLIISTAIANTSTGILTLLAAQGAAGILTVSNNLTTTGGAMNLYAGLDANELDLNNASSINIFMVATQTLSSNGGNINIKNSAIAKSVGTYAISLGSNTTTNTLTINAGGGNITLIGIGGSTGSRAIYFNNSLSNTITTTTGTISLYGNSGLGVSTYNAGIYFDGSLSGTVVHNIYTVSGDISITGIGTTGASTTPNAGIFIWGASNGSNMTTKIYSTNGSITLKGKTNCSTSSPYQNPICFRGVNQSQGKLYLGYDGSSNGTTGNIYIYGDSPIGTQPNLINSSAVFFIKGSGNLTIGSSPDTQTGSTGMTIASGMIKDGFSQITLGDSYTGPIKLGATGVLPDASQAIVSGTLDMNSFNETIGALSGTGTITNGSTGTPILTCGDATNTTFSGTIQNSLALIKQGSGSLTLTGTNSLSGSTTISSGTLALSSGLPNSAVTASGTLQLNNGSSIGSVPTYSGGSNLVYSTGSSVIAGNEWNGTGSSVGVGVPNNVIINNNTSVEITGNQTIPGNFTISSGSLTVDPAKQFTVSGTLSNNGSLNLNSDENGTATLLYGSNSGNGIANVQQYLSSARNWYISSPVNSSTVPDGYTFYSRNEAENNWTTMSTGDALTSGQGYIANLASGTATYTFTGILNTGDKTVNLQRTPLATKAGFNLIGNPNPSYASLLSLAAADSSNLETTYWIRSKNTGNTSYIFDTYKFKSGEYVSNSGKIVTGIIAPMQAFWVRVRSGFTSGQLIFRNADRSHQDNSGNVFRVHTDNTVNKSALRLQVSNGVNTDETLLYSADQASNEYDDFDSRKMSNSTTNVPEIYTVLGSEEMAINGLKTFSYNTEIPLGFRTGQTDTYKFKVSEINNLEPDTRVVLNDNLLNIQSDITTSEYTFNSDAITTQSRFSIILKSDLLLTGIDNSGKDVLNIRAYKNGNNQIVIMGITSVKKDGIITICNSIGQNIYSTKITESTTVINKPFISGVYFITVDISGEKITQKITI